MNYNTGAPSLSKDLLSKVLDICAELLCLDPEEITVFNAQTIIQIKERVTKNIELLLLMSCDEYLYPTDDGLDIFGGLTIEADALENIRQIEGLSRGPSNLSSRKRLLISLKNMLSSRFATSYIYVLNILDSFCSKLYQLGISHQDSVSEDLLELMLEIRLTLGFNHITEKCLGNFVSKVNMETLLHTLPIKVLEIDIGSDEFEAESNAFILSLLSIYKTKARFSAFYKHLWPQLLQIGEKIK